VVDKLSIKSKIPEKTASTNIPITKLFGQMIHYFPSPIDSLLGFMGKEINTGLSVSLSPYHRFRAYKHGFTSRAYRLFDLKNKTSLDNYLSNFHRIEYTGSINPNPEILDNKRLFYEFMFEQNLGKYLPDLLGYIQNGKFQGEKSLKDYLIERKKIIMRPCIGFSGSGIVICEWHESKMIVNGNQKIIESFQSKVREFDRYIVTEFCEQASFLNDIYPHSSNTIRIWTMNPQDKKPFIPIAILRIGRKKTGFLDNVDQGGLTAQINLETGELSSATGCPPSGKIKWHSNHPDTGSQIKGSKIPAWNQIKRELLSLVSEQPELKYVGWDILLTNENGKFVIIEGNNSPGFYSAQVHKPLLEDRLVRDFYRENGVPV